MNKIKQLRILLEKSTPGPWLAREGDVLNPDRTYGIVRVLSPEEHGCDPEEGERTEVIAEILAATGGVDAVDAELIALMKNTLPDILGAVDALEDARAAMWTLADEASDYSACCPELNDTWNEGGVGYETSRKVQAALEKLT